ncbi:MAG: M23 family metallopeptidase [Methylovulum sp.]|nr:M23 family metallopeptidase [Methylovulum sp.]
MFKSKAAMLLGTLAISGAALVLGYSSSAFAYAYGKDRIPPYWGRGNGQNDIASRYVPMRTQNISTVSFYLWRWYAPLGNVRARIYDAKGVLLGTSELADSENIPLTTIDTSCNYYACNDGAWIPFSFSSPVNLSSGLAYYISFSPVVANDNYIIGTSFDAGADTLVNQCYVVTGAFPWSQCSASEESLNMRLDFTPFLAFPLDCSTPNCSGGILYTQGAYTAKSVVSVLDHSMKKNDNGTYPYGKILYPSGIKGLDGIVLAWTGESGQETPMNQGCYPKLSGESFSIGGTYVSDKICSIKRLNYDDHPGYDYKAAYATPVKAAAPGRVVTINGEKCFKNNLPGTCADWGAVGINHGNGYISQYLHMSSISVNSGDKISEGQVIGYSGYTGLPSIESSHLHFEILKKVGNKYFTVDPYGWSGSCQSDPMYLWTGIRNVRLWK